MKPGADPRVSEAQYDRIQAVRNTTRERFRSRTPAHFRNAEDQTIGDADKYVFTFGSAFHVAVLEPDDFSTRVVEEPPKPVPPPGFRDFRSKVAQMHRDDELAKAKAFIDDARANGRHVLKPGDTEVVLQMAYAVHKHPAAAKLLGGPGRNELTLTWDDPCGLKLKARLDRLTQHDGFLSVVDLKSTTDASPLAFWRDADRYGYYRQAAFYLRGLDELHEKRFRPWLWIATEKDEPYLTAVYEADQDDLHEAAGQVDQDLRELAECMKSGVWPGYPDEVRILPRPVWKRRATEETTEL